MIPLGFGMLVAVGFIAWRRYKTVPRTCSRFGHLWGEWQFAAQYDALDLRQWRKCKRCEVVELRDQTTKLDACPVCGAERKFIIIDKEQS